MKKFLKREIQRILKNNGWKLDRCNGSHRIYKNEKNQHMTIPFPDCNKMIWRRLVKEYNLKVS